MNIDGGAADFERLQFTVDLREQRDRRVCAPAWLVATASDAVQHHVTMRRLDMRIMLSRIGRVRPWRYALYAASFPRFIWRRECPEPRGGIDSTHVRLQQSFR